MGRRIELERRLRQYRLGLLDLDRLVQVAIVGTADTTEDHMRLDAVDVIAKPEAGLELVLRRLAIVPGADVIVDVDAAQRQRLRVSLAGRRLGILAVEGGHHVGGRDVVEIRGGLFVIPAEAYVQGQVLVDRPVVLDIGAELLVAADRHRALARRGRTEYHLVGNRFGAVGRAHRIAEQGVRIAGVQRGQLYLLVLDAHLDHVVAVPLEIVEGQVVLQGRAFLALVLLGPRVIAGLQNGGVLVDILRIARARPERGRRRREKRVLIGHLQTVEPAVGAVIPAQVVAFVGVVGVERCRGRDHAANAGHRGFGAVFAAQFETVAIGRLPVDLAEPVLFLERQAGRSDLRAGAGRNLAGIHRETPRSPRGRRIELLARVGDEEMRLVLDDRAAQVEAVVLLVRDGLLVIEFLGRRFRAHGGVGEITEDVAVGGIGAGLGLRHHSGTRNLVVFRLVVGGDDLVFANRQLRERVALAGVLAGDATGKHVILLTDTIDVDVDRAAGLGAGAQAGVAVRVAGE